MSEMYTERLLDHYRNPRNRGSLVGTSSGRLLVAEEYNPLCGDRVLLRFQVDGGEIRAAAFDGAACAICLASASLLCKDVPGKKVSYVQATHDWLQNALKGGGEPQGPQDLQALLGVRRYPSRIKCAMLPWIAAVKALTG